MLSNKRLRTTTFRVATASILGHSSVGSAPAASNISKQAAWSALLPLLKLQLEKSSVAWWPAVQHADQGRALVDNGVHVKAAGIATEELGQCFDIALVVEQSPRQCMMG
jgi:hypothetical protein